MVSRAAQTNATPTNIYSAKLNGTNLYLAWPGDHTGWRLQGQSNSLSVGISTNWTTIAGASLTNQFVLPIPQGNGVGFYRMILP